MDLPPRELAPNGPRPRKALLVPALIVGALGLLAVAAVLDWPKSEPQARRQLTLRAAELEAWLRQELLAPQERVAFTEAGGAPEAAPAWQSLFVALESQASRGIAQMPSLAATDELALHVETALGARRFTPFLSIDALLDDDWPRRARLFATLLEQAPAPADGSLARWLDVAVVFAADLRSTGLFGPALHSARLEEVVARRLARLTDPLEPLALIDLHDHALAARAALPPAQVLAEREQRLLQSSLCMLADIPPFQPAHERLAPDENWPLIVAAAAVEQLEGYDDQLALLLGDPPSDRARASYDAFAERVVAQVPRLAPLLADGASTVPLRGTARRLERIAEAAAARAPGIERGASRQ
ncbi:MAG: hypothetical protein JNL90_01515 [Planctomycetes bacterium]|nr:hypothetical protein [Planctomycetota bacterium]